MRTTGGFNILTNLTGSTANEQSITFLYTSASYTSSYVSGALASISTELINSTIEGATGKLLFKVGDSGDVKTTGSVVMQMFSTGSNNEPRVGIGFEKDETLLKVFEIKTKSDTPEGSEFLIRSSRLSKGAEVGDLGGAIRFSIDSASFQEITTSGSIALIDSIVTTVEPEGVTGDLAFNVASSARSSPTEIMRLRGDNNSVDVTGSFHTTKGTKFGTSTVNTHTFTGSVNIHGDLDVSGDITASSAQLTTITGPSNQLVELGNYPVGYDVVSSFPITGSGAIVSASSLASNHYNMVKIGEVELIDLNSLINPKTFLIHNLDNVVFTSGSDSGDIASSNYMFTHLGSAFNVYNNGTIMHSINNGAVSFATNTTQFTVQNSTGNVNLIPASGDIYARINTEQTSSTTGIHSVPVFATDPSTTSGGLIKNITASAFLPKFQVNGGTFLGQTTQRALPFGSTTGESTLFTYTTTYMIPTKCTLLKVHTMSQANAGNLTLKAYTIPATTADNTAISNGTLIKSVTVASHDAGDPFEFDFNTGSFEAGTKFGLTAESDTNPNGFRFTAFFREDL